MRLSGGVIINNLVYNGLNQLNCTLQCYTKTGNLIRRMEFCKGATVMKAWMP